MRLFAASWLILLPGLAAAVGAPGDAPSALAPAAKGSTMTFEKDIHPFIQKYCFECHGNGAHKGDVTLDKFKLVADVDKDAKLWEDVQEKVHTHEMPPDEAKLHPTEIERDQLSDWIDHEIYKYDPSNPDPGRITLHRLNRAEYSNTIRDLTGIDFKATDDFPPDDSGYGFDNNGDVLSLPPMLMEKYLAAADKILDQAIATDPIPYKVQRYPAYLAEIGFNAVGVNPLDNWVELISLEEDDVAVDLDIPATGDYLVRFRAYTVPTGGMSVGGGNNARPQTTDAPAPQQMSIRVGDTVIKRFAVTLDKDAVRAAEPGKMGDPGVYEARIGLAKGIQHVRVAMDRLRGGAYEQLLLNGRVGKQQPGKAFMKWIEVEGPLPSAVQRFSGDQLTVNGEHTDLPTGERELTKNGDVSVKFNVPKEGDYVLRAYAYAQQAGNETTKMDLRVDGKSLQTIDVMAPARRVMLPGARIFSGHPAALSLLRAFPECYEIHTKLTPGEKTFSAAFINDAADPDNADPNLRKRNLFIQSLEVVDLSSPAQLPPMPAQIKQYFTQTPTPENKTALARDILTQFTRRAWRRPVPSAEIDRLMKLFDLADKNGDGFESCVKLAMKAVLVSPHFLFRDEAPDAKAMAAMPTKSPVAAKTAATMSPTPASLGVPVDEYTLASRLSYFLWSSTPDDELLSLADKGQLRAHLGEQVQRMIASPKARAMVDNFAGQWLQFRSLATFEPDKTLFPNFSPEIRDDMQKETESFFDYIMRQNRSVLEFLTADYTFANARLADFYGLKGATGDDFQKISLDGTPRRGVITQGSVLVLTSNPTRTSPVKRGKWVLDNLLGTPPPPPPPNVPVLDEETQLTGTLRQQMEQHRAMPVCASCHARMDPIGFGLEDFDATGAFRSMENADTDHPSPIDTSGQLLTGETFKGAAELADILADKKRGDFLRCISEKMLTYALGRGLEYYDRAATDKMVQQLTAGDYKFDALINGAINSIPFQEMRRSEPAPAATADAPAVAAEQQNKVAQQ